MAASAGAGVGQVNGAAVTDVRRSLLSWGAHCEASGSVTLCPRELSKSASHLLVINMHRKLSHAASSSGYRKGLFSFS